MKTKPDTVENSEMSMELYNSFLNMLHGFAYCKMIYKNGKPHDFTYLKVNKAFEELTGLKNVEGKKISEVIPGVLKNDPKIIELYGKVASTGIPGKFEIYVESLSDWYMVSVQSPKKDYFVAIFDVITEQKNAEEKLQYNKDNLDIIFNSTDESIALISTDEILIDLNDEGLRRLGKAKSEIIGKKVLDVLPPEAAKHRKPFLYRALKNGEKVVFEDKIYGRWMLNHLYPIFDDKGKVLRVAIFSRDITDKKQAIDALTESEIKYRLLFENMSNGFAIHEVITDDNNNPVDFRFIEANQYYSKFSIFGTANIKGKTVRELKPDADKEMIRKYCEVGITGVPFELEYYSHTFNRYFKVYCYCPKKGFFASIFEDISERKTIEEELAKSREQYKLLAENSTDAVILINADKNVEYVSSSYLRLLGYSMDEEVKMDFYSFIERTHPDDRKQVADEIKRGDEQKNPASRYEYRARTKSGNYIWFEDIFQREYDDEGNFVRTIVNLREITHRKKIEELLTQTRHNYESFFNTIDEFLFVLDEQGNIIHTNKTVTDRLGFLEEELIGKSVLTVHPEDRRDEAGRIVGEMLSGLAEFCPVPLITKSGMQIPVETRVTKGLWDGMPVIFGVTKDISAIRFSEEKFSKLFHVNPSACGLSNLETHEYAEVNEAFYDLLGFEKDEVIGKTAMELGILPAEAVTSIMQKADKNGNVNNAETFLKAKNGELKHVLLSAENIYVQDIKYRYTVVNDITQIKMAEEEIIRQKDELQRVNAEKDKFFSIIAHDLRSPFTGFLGFTQILVNDINNMSLTDLNKIAISLHKSANNIYGLLTNLLEWAKMQRGLTMFKPEKLSVRKITDETLNISKEIAEGKNIELVNNIDENILIQADRAMLETIMRNLISNALKFTTKGGRVIVSSNVINDNVEISVKDSGIGMSKELINDLFRIDKKTGRVGTDKEPSSGLGLLLCKEFVVKHNGSISVESKEGKGSEFIVSLPVSR